MAAPSTSRKPRKRRSIVNRKGSVNPEFADRERRFLRKFSDDKACLDYLLRLRFGTRIKCPKCDRTAKFHKIRLIPAYACQWCGYHLHPMAQTRFARSRVGLRIWFHAILLFAQSNSFSARELQLALDLTYKTAWRMRNTIIDAKFHLPRDSSKGGQVDFERLLGALISSEKADKPVRRIKGGSA